MTHPGPVAVDDNSIYWGARDATGSGILQRAPLTGGTPETLQVLGAPTFSVDVADIVLAGDYVYYLERIPNCVAASCGGVTRVRKDGSGRQTLGGRYLPLGLAATEDAVYWVDAGYASGSDYTNGGVYALSPPEPGTPTKLIDISGGLELARGGDTLFVASSTGVYWFLATGDALQPIVTKTSTTYTFHQFAGLTTDDTYVYWTLCLGNGGGLYRWPLAGGDLEPLRSMSCTTVLKADAGHVYAAVPRAVPDTIVSISADGSKQVTLASTPQIVDLAVDAARVYWSQGDADGMILAIER